MNQIAEQVAQRAASLEEAVAFNKALSKLLGKLKKDIGALYVNAGYKGTGSRKARKQMFIRLKDDTAFDMWLEEDRIQFGGVMGAPRMPEHIDYNGRKPEEVYAEILEAFKKAGY